MRCLMSAKSNNLSKAKLEKNDEFYTKLSDIENELKYYKDHFKNKVVFCNCDDPFESNFFKYFAMNFNALHLKKLIATSYTGSPIVGKDLSYFINSNNSEKIQNKKAYKVTMSELNDTNNDGRTDLEDVEEIIKHRIRYLNGDGSFQSEESIELLKDADVIVTNPPFSKAIEFISLLFKYNKLFLIIGDLNWISNKDVFRLLKENKIWLGNTSVKKFMQPSGETKKFGNKCWFTNLDILKRHSFIELYKKYDPIDYPKYDNYNAIEVSKVSEIPDDYYDVMGVPITFINSYNPEQFEILGRRGDLEWAENECSFFTPPSKEHQEKYKKLNKTWRVQNTYLLTNDGIPKITYARIFIRRK